MKTKLQERFEELAVRNGMSIADLTPHESTKSNLLRRYKNGNVQRAFDFFRMGVEDGKKHTGSHFIIGKVIHANGQRIPKFSENPVIHTSKFTARQELRRLAMTCPNHNFILYASITSSSKGNHGAAGDMNTKVFFGTFADDGFGNRTKVPFEQRKQFCIDNQEII